MKINLLQTTETGEEEVTLIPDSRMQYTDMPISSSSAYVVPNGKIAILKYIIGTNTEPTTVGYNIGDYKTDTFAGSTSNLVIDVVEPYIHLLGGEDISVAAVGLTLNVRLIEIDEGQLYDYI